MLSISWGHHTLRRTSKEVAILRGSSLWWRQNTFHLKAISFKQTSYQKMLISTLHFKHEKKKKTSQKWIKRNMVIFPNLLINWALKKKIALSGMQKWFIVTYFWSTKPHDSFYQKRIKQNILYLQVSQTLSERLIRTEIKIVFLPTLPSRGNKISHQNTLAWLILKSEEEDFLRKQVSWRPLGVRLFLICFCVALWRFFFKHKNQETDFLNLVTALKHQNSSSKKLKTWTKSLRCA